MKAIILAAGIGKRIKKFTTDPKCLIKIKNESLIVRSIKALHKVNIKDIVVIVGYKKDKVIRELRDYNLKAKVLNNDDFLDGSIVSLWTARDELNKEVVIMDADVYFDTKILDIVVNSPKKNFFVIDNKEKKDDEAVIVGFNNGRAAGLARGLQGNYSLMGEWAGLLKLSPEAARKLKSVLRKKALSRERKIGYEFVIPELFGEVFISYELTKDLAWAEIDFPKDVKKARSLNIN